MLRMGAVCGAAQKKGVQYVKIDINTPTLINIRPPREPEKVSKKRQSTAKET
jgi:hypothetical protein